MADDESTPAGGRLLGTSKLQAAVDGLATTVGKITQTLQQAKPGLATATGSGTTSGNGGDWRGKPNGGQPALPGGRPYDQHVLGGGQSTQASPGATNGAGRAGAAVGGAVAAGVTALGSYGTSKLGDMVTMQTAAALATQGNSMGWRAASNQAFRNNYGAQSTADAAGAYLTTARTTGYQAGTAQFGAQWNYAKTASLVNPNISQTQAAQASASLWQGSSYNSLRGYGIQTIKGGVGQSPRQIAQQILQKIPGTSSIKSGDQLTAALDAPAGGINQTLMAWSAQGMLGGQSADVVREEIRGILLAQIKGTGYDQYSQMMNQAASGNKTAKASLSKMGIGNTSAQTLMNREGTLRNRDDSELGGFTTGLNDSVAALDKFSNAITGFLNRTGLGGASGFGASVTSMLGGTVGGSAALGLLGKIPGVGGLLKGVLGGGGGGDGISGGDVGVSGSGGGPAAGSVATGTSGAGKTGAAAIAIAKKYLGMPYHWGGNSPKSSFDCSGLMQYVFKQIGVSLPRTAKQQQTVGSAVSLAQVQPGDLVFIGKPAHHVAMYIGGGKIIEAPHTGANIQIRSFNAGEWTGGARRILGSVGNMNSADPNSDTAGSDSTMLNQGLGGGDIGSYSSEADALAGLLGGMSGVGASGGTTGQTGGATSTNTAPPSSGGATNGQSGNLALGQRLSAQRGWTGSEWNSLKSMWTKESGWNNNAQNPSSTAFGIPQLLNGTWAETGYSKSSDPTIQINAGLNYISKRYGDPNKAWAYWQKHHSYARGTLELGQDQTINAHKGEIIVPADQSQDFRTAMARLTSGNTSMGGGKTPVQITFGPGSLSFTGVVGNASDASAFGKQVVDAIVEDDRFNTIASGG